jgi:subtilisin family serine protease
MTAFRQVRSALLPGLLVSAALAGPAQAETDLLAPTLRAQVALAPEATQLVWVFFRDKGPDPETRLRDAEASLWPRARSRRTRRSGREDLVEVADLPVYAPYVAAIGAHVSRVRHASRWENALSVEATGPQLRELELFDWVAGMSLVGRHRPVEIDTRSQQRAPETSAPAGAHLLDYGPSFDQLEQIGVPSVHDLGLHGQDVVIAVLDTGFDNLEHEAFSLLSIVAAYDFVNGDPDVSSGEDRGSGEHGTRVLSVIGGYKTGELIGPAFGASFILAKTEDTWSETPIEEDNWVAAAEWAEALGAEIITTSLGYTIFDSGDGYGPGDLDGATAVISRAAQRATELGVVVLSSAGNSGIVVDAPERNTLVAPADAAGVLAVGAVDAMGERADFSSIGPSADGRIKPDVMALGVGVRAASPFIVSGYGPGSGTSFACPLSAGVAALVLQAHPDYGVEQVGQALRLTGSQAAAPDNRMGFGILDAFAAVQIELPVGVPEQQE